MSSHVVVISKGASADMSKLAAGKNRADVALEALKGELLSPGQIAALQTLAKCYESSAVSLFATKIEDSMFAFQVPGNQKLSQGFHINTKLGADASFLISGLESIGVQLDRAVPEHSRAVVSRESDNKTLYEQKMFYADGLASPCDAVNIAMEAVCAAKQVGIDLRNINGGRWETNKAVRVESEAVAKGLDKGTATLLGMLTKGLIRFDAGRSSGALYVDVHGRLGVYDYCDYLGHDYGGFRELHGWAFGASPSAKSESLPKRILRTVKLVNPFNQC
jgi:hypothetical protein